MINSGIPNLTTDFTIPKTIQFWRTQILNWILYALFTLSTLAMINITIGTLQGNRFDLLLIYSGIYIVTAATTFIKRWRYTIRASLLLFIIYSLSLIEFAQLGLWSKGTLFLLGFITLAATLFNLRISIFALVASTITLSVLAWMSITELYLPQQITPYHTSLISWVSTGLTLLILSTATVIPVRYLIQRLETELFTTQANYSFVSTVLNLAGALVMVVDKHGHIVRFNQTCEKLTGYTFKEVQNQPFWDIFIATSKRKAVKKYFNELNENQSPLQLEQTWFTKSGKEKVISWSITILSSGSGAIRYIVTVGIDITHKKQEEQERENLLIAEREQRQFAEALHDISFALNSTLNLEELLTRIITNIGRVVPHNTADVVLIENNATLRVVGSSGYTEQGHKSPLGSRYTFADVPNIQQMAQTGLPLIVTDSRTNPNWVVHPSTEWIRAFVGVPIQIRGEIKGFLNLAGATPNFFNKTHAARLQTFGNQAGMAIGNVQQLKTVREQHQFSEALRKASMALGGTLKMDTLLDRLLEHVCKIVPYNAANIMLTDHNREQITIARHSGYEQFGKKVLQDVTNLSLNISQTANLRQMAETGTPAYISDTAAHKDWVATEASKLLRSWVGAPIIINNKVIAFFSLDKKEPHFYQPEHLERLAIFANQTALAIENVRLFDAEARRRLEAENLRKATASLTSELELREVLDNILTQLRQVIPYDSACMFLNQNNLLSAVAEKDLPYPEQIMGKNFSVDDAIFTQLKNTRLPFSITDTRKDPRFLGWGETSYIRGWMGIPMIVRQEVIGYLTLDSRSTGTYDNVDVSTVQTFTHQATVAITNAQMFEQTQTALAQTDTLYRIMRSLISFESLPNLLQDVVNGTVEALNADRIVLITLNIEQREVIHFIVGGPGSENVVKVTFDELWDGLTGWVIRHKKPALSHKKEIDTRESQAIQQRRQDTEAGAIIVVPLIYRNKMLGTITAINHPDQPDFNQPDVDMMLAIANQVAIALENVRLFEAINQRVTELEAIRQVSLSLTSSLELPAVLETILKTSTKIISTAQNAHIFLYQNKKLIFGAAILEDGTVNYPFSEPRSNGLTYTIAKTGEIIVISDMTKHSLFTNAPSRWTGAIIGLPLKIGQDVVGVMTISSQKPRVWQNTELQALGLLADQAAIAIENARLYKQVQQHATELENIVDKRTFDLQILYELTQALGQANQFDDAIHLILRHLHQAIPHSVGACLLVTETTNSIIIRSRHALSQKVDVLIQRTLLETFAKLRGRPLHTDNIEIQRLQPAINLMEKPPLTTLGSLIKTPIVIARKTVGILFIANQKKIPFTLDQTRLLNTMAEQAAETIGRLQLLLAAEHQRLESLMTHLPNGVILLDVSQHIVLINQTAKLLASALIKAEVGDRLTHIGQHPIDAILASTANKSVFSEKIKDRDFKRLVEIDVNQVTAGPESGGWILVIRDVTQDQMIQKQIQQQERMAAVGQLAAGIAHDFNNILTSIIGFAELLLFDQTLSAQAKSDIDRIIKQGNRAAHLVRQILDFSRQTITEKYALDLIPFVKETIKLLERTLPEDLYITTDIKAGEFVITADLTQMQQALTNLAVNARDAMPAGGTLNFGLSCITLHSNDALPTPNMFPGRWIVLQVSDTGTGIPKELQEQIFEPFFTTKEVGKGTGLGLAQVYGIITQQEGFITVESQLEKGTTFSMYFPPHTSSQRPTPPDTSPLNMPLGQQEIILLVEDDEVVLEAGTTMLQHLNYKVLTATNGYEALEIYRKHQHEIALVFTDMAMPKMGGAELTAKLCKQNPAVKVVALTGYPMNDEAKKLLSLGIIDWMQKPLSLKKLAKTLHKVIRLA